MPKITISPLPRPIYAGDWHDAPLRWTVNGPAAEVQNFSTRDNARRYAKLRCRLPDFNTACNAYVRGES